MKTKLVLLVFTVLPALFFPSCVAKKKYAAATSRAATLAQENSTLRSQVNTLNEQLRELQGRLGKMEATNEFTSGQLNMSKEELERQRERLRHLLALIEQQRKNTQELRKKIADALTGFSSSQLTVSSRNGKVYVSMQESLLFPSGSAIVNPKGREALATLSKVLNQNPDINVEVEGHTDSVPISKRYQDNWELSVERSTAISRIMINEYGVAPSRITASGRSKYDPIASNETPEGRQSNRRTEIILEPKLDELMDLIRGSETQAGR